MNTHTFTANSIQQALEKVRHTLGPDAIVLSTESRIEESQAADGSQQRIITVKACCREDLPNQPCGVQADETIMNETAATQIVVNIESATSYIEQLYQQEQ